MQEFFFLYFDQDNIFSDLIDTAPGNHIFRILTEKPTEFTGSGQNQSRQLPGIAVKFHIGRTAQAFAGTDIDNLFLF